MENVIGKTKVTDEKLFKEAKKLIGKEGAKGWNLAKETLLEQETRNSQLKEALNYIAELPEFFRPAIVSLCCKAVGGKSENTIPCGASFIMLGKAIGIHDDIIDNLRIRNKRLTFFGKFGKEIALIISDILVFKAFTLMRKNTEFGISQQTNAKILQTIDKFWFEQGESEILELQSRKKLEIMPQESLAKIKMRASELEAITRIGGILGNGSKKEIEALGVYGRLLGTASILRDELIDMLEPDVLSHRIQYESLPLPLNYAMQKLESKAALTSAILKKRLTKADLYKISKVVDEAQGIKYVADLISKTANEARSQLEMFKDKKDELQLLTASLVIKPNDWKTALSSM
ncbi:polyprenyl synthetase family protein [Candidatus Bathyarchaeota archaeon]|nr:polyprenyl synthetase family protein [Candidatus Bathyarchaeota archaeon]